MQVGEKVTKSNGQSGTVKRINIEENMFTAVFNQENLAQIEYYSLTHNKFLGYSVVEAREALMSMAPTRFEHDPFRF